MTTAAPLVALLWLGFNVLDHDRQIERQQLRERLDRSAEFVVATIQQQVEKSEQALASGQGEWPHDVVTLTVHAGVPVVSPRRRVAFLPGKSPDGQIDDGRFAGLIRSARARELAGERQAALAIYARMASVDDVFIADTPVSLAASYARCRLLDAHGDRAQLVLEAGRMLADLDASRWALTAPVYWLYREDAIKWAGAPVAAPQSELLAAAAGALWEQWRDMPLSKVPAQGHATLSIGQTSVTAIWTTAGGERHALIAMPDFVRHQWLAAAEEAAAAEGVSLSIGSSDGDGVVKTSAQTALPWPIAVNSLDSSAERAQFAARRHMLMAGFALLVAMGVGAGAATVRAVSRELAVARLQSDFISTVSHEFRTPLTTLRQFTDRLQDNPELAAADRAICYEAQGRSTERLTRLVESLLDFGRMQAGSRPYVLAAVDCADVIQEVVSEFRRVRHGAEPPVIHFHREGPAPVMADREALALAVWNLVDNAVKYSPVPAKVEVDVMRSADRVTVAVRDYGFGIPHGERLTIFQKFQRGQEARARGLRGTGLGLAIVDHIVGAHRGQVSVQSAVGKGSTFTISLPVC
jgi:signal transduction histidine kinase